MRRAGLSSARLVTSPHAAHSAGRAGVPCSTASATVDAHNAVRGELPDRRNEGLARPPPVHRPMQPRSATTSLRRCDSTRSALRTRSAPAPPLAAPLRRAETPGQVRRAATRLCAFSYCCKGHHCCKAGAALEGACIVRRRSPLAWARGGPWRPVRPEQAPVPGGLQSVRCRRRAGVPHPASRWASISSRRSWLPPRCVHASSSGLWHTVTPVASSFCLPD